MGFDYENIGRYCFIVSSSLVYNKHQHPAGWLIERINCSSNDLVHAYYP